MNFIPNATTIRIAERLAGLGYSAAVVGPSEIQTDAPESACREATDAIMGAYANLVQPKYRRKRRAARSASPAAAPKRRRRRKTTKQLRRKVRGTRIKVQALAKRHIRRGGRGVSNPMFAAFLARRKLATQLERRTSRKAKPTKRRGKRRGKTWTAAARAAFAAKMKAARKFYRKAKR